MSINVIAPMGITTTRDHLSRYMPCGHSFPYTGLYIDKQGSLLKSIRFLSLPTPNIRCAFSSHSNIFEPQRSAIFSLQPRFSSVKLSRITSPTFRRVWTIVKWNMVVSDVLEPVAGQYRAAHSNPYGQGSLLTNESCSHPQTDPTLCCELEHRPIAHRKTLRFGPGA